MKQIILFLLISASVFAQNPTKLEKLRITNNETSTTATKVNVQESNGLVNTIAKADLIEVLEYSTASAMPVTGVSGKIYVTIDNNILYRWNGTVYVPLSADISGKEDKSNKVSTLSASAILYPNNNAVIAGLALKENLANKQNSLTVDGTGVKYPTVDAANAGLALKRDVTNYVFTSDLSVNSITVGRGGGNASSNTAFGVQSLLFNSTGTANATNGFQSLLNNTTGNNNTAVGFQTLRSNTTGGSNTANGYQTLSNNTTGGSNTANGYQTLFNNTTGNNNTANGFQAGRFITDGINANALTNNSIYLGFNTKALADNQTNQTVIGYDATGLGSNTTVIGNSSTTAARLWGRFLSGTSVDNGIDQIQVPNGTISALPATLSNQVVVKSQLDLKANIASPTFTGVPSVPTATAGTNTPQIASTAFVLVENNQNVKLAGAQTIAGEKTFTTQVQAPSFQVAGGNYKTSTVGTGLVDDISGASITTNVVKGWTVNSPLKAATLNTNSYTVATLPTGIQGATAYVTDATSPIYLGALTGGGTVKCPVFFNGTIWVSH